jgi:hypothetical protein
MRVLGKGNRKITIVLATLLAAGISGGAVLAMATGGDGSSGPKAAKPVGPSPGTGLNSGNFDDLTADVPKEPGADGRTGTAEPASADVPVDGATRGPKTMKTGRIGAVNGIPRGVFPAYRSAAISLGRVRPGCGLTWPLLAGVGKVESGHAAGGRVNRTGTTRGLILGPALDGSPGLGKVRDTDKGRLDKDRVWDRPVGPMQMVPSVWRKYSVDGNGDDVRSPNNMYDATAAVGVFLCGQNEDLRNPRDLVRALLRYDHSRDFVATVLRWMRVYSRSVVITPNRPGIIETGSVDRRDDPRDVPEVIDPNRPDHPVPTDSVTSTPTDRTSTTPTRPTATLPSDWPTSTWTPRPTPTPTKTPSPTPTKTPTSTPTTTPTPTPTPTSTITPTSSPTQTAISSASG